MSEFGGVEVRLASEDELPLVHEIMLAAFGEYRGVLEPPSGALEETVEDVRRSVSTGGAVLGFIGGKAVGSARFDCKGDHLYCSRISVLPAARRKGVAVAMLNHVHEVAKARGFAEVRLSTRRVMESNQRLYLQLGYRIVGCAPHPKGEGEVLELAKGIS